MISEIGSVESDDDSKMRMLLIIGRAATIDLALRSHPSVTVELYTYMMAVFEKLLMTH